MCLSLGADSKFGAGRWDEDEGLFFWLSILHSRGSRVQHGALWVRQQQVTYKHQYFSGSLLKCENCFFQAGRVLIQTGSFLHKATL